MEASSESPCGLGDASTAVVSVSVGATFLCLHKIAPKKDGSYQGYYQQSYYRNPRLPCWRPDTIPASTGHQRLVRRSTEPRERKRAFR